MGGFDRVFRIIIAAIIAILFFTHVLTGTLAVVLMVIAVILLLTSIIGICPLYNLLGINTCARKHGNTSV